MTIRNIDVDVTGPDSYAPIAPAVDLHVGEHVWVGQPQQLFRVVEVHDGRVRLVLATEPSRFE